MIKCSNCDQEIEITTAIKKELEEKILQETQAKYDAKMKQLQIENEHALKEKEKEVELVKERIVSEARKEAIERVRKEYDAKIESTKEESLEREKQNKEFFSIFSICLFVCYSQVCPIIISNFPYLVCYSLYHQSINQPANSANMSQKKSAEREAE